MAGLVVGLAGCHVVLPLRSPETDGPRPVDGAADTGQAFDAPTDASGDTADTGQPFDGPADAPSFNDTADGKPGVGGCNPLLAQEFKTTSTVPGKLEYCEDAGAKQHDQCGAAQLCNTQGGWSLCPATRYQQLVTSPQGRWAWIAGCVRDGAGLQAPVDGPCTCDNAVGASVTSAWTCYGAGGATSDSLHLGLITYDKCRWVGVADPVNAGFWLPQGVTAFTSDTAVCCHP